MATLQELRDRIFAKLDDGVIQSPTQAQMDEQINLSCEYYDNDKFWFFEAIANLTLTVGDPVVSGLPADFKEFIEPNAVTVIEGQVRYPLEHITPLAYNSINSEGLGLPRWFTYEAGQLKVYYYPSQAYECNVFYRKKSTQLVNDSDSNVLTENAERLIEYKTLEDVLRDYRSDFQRAAVYEQKAKDELRQILRETYNRTATGNVSTENIVSPARREYYRY